MKYYEDPILGKGRATDVSGGTGGTSYVGGDRINIAGGTISFVNSADIVNVTGTSVTLQPDTAYKIYATSQAITLNANPPAAGKWAYEGHIELFVAGTGYVVTGSNVVLANALEPDAVNNCTVRFHDGIAIISVEDHVAGYIVVNGSTAGEGSLAYGIATSTNDYVAFDASLNGTTIPLAGAVAEGEKHLVGNGYQNTIVSGGINCTSKTTFANLGMSNVVVSSGTLTLGDVFIPSGSTVAVSGGGLAVEKVTGDGGVIDLGGTHIYSLNGAISIANVTLTSGTGSTENAGGAVYLFNAEATINGVTITGNTATAGGGVSLTRNNAVLNASNSYIKGNHAIVSGAPATSRGDDVYITSGAIFNALGGCEIGGCALASNGGIIFAGSNKIDSIEPRSASVGNGGTVTLTSGAILDLAGNANAKPIAPGGGITFGGSNQIIYGTTEKPTTAYIDGCTAATIASGGVVQLSTVSGGTVTVPRNISVSSGMTWSANRAVFSAGVQRLSAYGGGGFYVSSGGTLALNSCGIIGCSGSYGGAVAVMNGGYAILSSCNIESNTNNTGAVYVQGNASATLELADCTLGAGQEIRIIGSNGTVIIKGQNTLQGTQNANGTIVISSGASINLTSSIAPGGGIVVEAGGCTVNGVEVAGGTYASIVSSGGSAVVNQ